MEDQPHAEETRRRMTDKERQAAKRAKDRAIVDGTYVKPPLELAKEYLAA